VLEAEFPLVLRAAALGDERAFARLWRDAHPPLLRYLRVLAGDAAEDVAGEVWLEVARKLARFRGGEPEFRGWLFTLARGRVIDLRRYTARHPARVTADAGDLDRPAPDDTAAAALERMSTEAALVLIATLPGEQAEVIVLRVVAGLDVGQVARIVGKRPGAVRVAAHRGRGPWPPGCRRRLAGRRCNAMSMSNGSPFEMPTFPLQHSPVAGRGVC
jgi:RNA polymerase sigma-70 factor (ECF subfamily)